MLVCKRTCTLHYGIYTVDGSCRSVDVARARFPRPAAVIIIFRHAPPTANLRVSDESTDVTESAHVVPPSGGGRENTGFRPADRPNAILFGERVTSE